MLSIPRFSGSCLLFSFFIGTRQISYQPEKPVPKREVLPSTLIPSSPGTAAGCCIHHNKIGLKIRDLKCGEESNHIMYKITTEEICELFSLFSNYHKITELF